MSSFWTLGLIATLLGGPVDTAELGGSVVSEAAPKPLPAVVPIKVTLFDGALPVATALADLDGRYRLEAPPGEYWLQVTVGATEAHVERVQLKAGSWWKSFALEVPKQVPEPIARL